MAGLSMGVWLAPVGSVVAVWSARVAATRPRGIRRRPAKIVDKNTDLPPCEAVASPQGPLTQLLQRVRVHATAKATVVNRRSWGLACLLGFIVLQSYFSNLLSMLLVAAPLLSARVLLQWRARKEAKRLNALLLPFAEELARNLRTGATSLGALRQAAESTGGVQAFRQLASQCRSGATLADVLGEFSACAKDATATEMANMLLFGERLGCLSALFVDGIVNSMYEQRQLIGEIASLSDQAKYSGALMVVAPILFSVGLVGTDSRARNLMLHTNLGAIILTVGLSLDLVGFLTMARISRRVTR